jgi:hypothetical protein
MHRGADNIPLNRIQYGYKRRQSDRATNDRKKWSSKHSLVETLDAVIINTIDQVIAYPIATICTACPSIIGRAISNSK